MVTISHEGFVCTDCIMFIANNDTSGIGDYEGWQRRVTETNATENGRYMVVPTGDDDPRFSSMGCDFCGSKLAGDVHHVAFLEN